MSNFLLLLSLIICISISMMSRLVSLNYVVLLVAYANVQVGKVITVIVIFHFQVSLFTRYLIIRTTSTINYIPT